MKIASVRVGDIVECKVRDWRFYAHVTGGTAGELSIEPINSHVTTRHVVSREVIGHWRKAGRRDTSPRAAASNKPPLSHS